MLSSLSVSLCPCIHACLIGGILSLTCHHSVVLIFVLLLFLATKFKNICHLSYLYCHCWWKMLQVWYLARWTQWTRLPVMRHQRQWRLTLMTRWHQTRRLWHHREQLLAAWSHHQHMEVLPVKVCSTQSSFMRFGWSDSICDNLSVNVSIVGFFCFCSINCLCLYSVC